MSKLHENSLQFTLRPKRKRLAARSIKAMGWNGASWPEALQ
jgi:hypothetical protein